MTWTYTGNPNDSDKDEVRFLIGDTEFSKQQMTDEEINWAIGEESNTRTAAARLAQSLAMKFGRLVDKSVGDLKLSYSNLYKQYQDLSEMLAGEASSTGVTPYCGGISVSDKNTVEENPDRVQPSIRKGMNDNPTETPSEQRYSNRYRNY